MPPLHLRDEAARDVVERERAALFRDHRVKQNLEQYVAELFAHQRIVGELNRLVQFVCFLDQIRAQRLVGLRRIPVASLAQIAHEFECIVESRVL